MRLPRIITHVLDHESTTVTLGFLVFIAATGGLFHGRIIDADTWLFSVFIATTLVGGKLIANSVLEGLAMRLKVPPPPPSKEAPDAPAPAAPPPAQP